MKCELYTQHDLYMQTTCIDGGERGDGGERDGGEGMEEERGWQRI